MKRKEELTSTAHSFFTLKGILFFGANIFIFLSCITFQHRFPEKNWLGITGYLTAWLLHYLFGITSYIILAFSFWISIQKLLKNPIKNFKSKLLYFAILIISISIYATFFLKCILSIMKSFKPIVIRKPLNLSCPFPTILLDII